MLCGCLQQNPLMWQKKLLLHRPRAQGVLRNPPLTAVAPPKCCLVLSLLLLFTCPYCCIAATPCSCCCPLTLGADHRWTSPCMYHSHSHLLVSTPLLLNTATSPPKCCLMLLPLLLFTCSCCCIAAAPLLLLLLPPAVLHIVLGADLRSTSPCMYHNRGHLLLSTNCC